MWNLKQPLLALDSIHDFLGDGRLVDINERNYRTKIKEIFMLDQAFIWTSFRDAIAQKLDTIKKDSSLDADKKKKELDNLVKKVHDSVEQTMKNLVAQKLMAIIESRLPLLDPEWQEFSSDAIRSTQHLDLVKRPNFEENVFHKVLLRAYNIPTNKIQERLLDTEVRSLDSNNRCVRFLSHHDITPAEVYRRLTTLYACPKLVFINDANAITKERLAIMGANTYYGLAAENDESKISKDRALYKGKDVDGISYVLRKEHGELLYMDEYGKNQESLFRRIGQNTFHIDPKQTKASVASLGQKLYLLTKLFGVQHPGFSDVLNPESHLHVHLVQWVRKILDVEFYKTYGIALDSSQVDLAVHPELGVALSPGDYLLCLLDIKGSADRLQAKAVESLNAHPEWVAAGQKAAFVSNDRCAVAYAAIMGIPCIWTSGHKKKGEDKEMIVLNAVPSQVETLVQGQEGIDALTDQMRKATLGGMYRSIRPPASASSSRRIRTARSHRIQAMEPFPAYNASLLHPHHSTLSRLFQCLALMQFPMTLLDYVQLVMVFQALPVDHFDQMEQTSWSQVNAYESLFGVRT